MKAWTVSFEAICIWVGRPYWPWFAWRGLFSGQRSSRVVLNCPSWTTLPPCSPMPAFPPIWPACQNPRMYIDVASNVMHASNCSLHLPDLNLYVWFSWPSWMGCFSHFCPKPSMLLGSWYGPELAEHYWYIFVCRRVFRPAIPFFKNKMTKERREHLKALQKKKRKEIVRKCPNGTV